MSSLRNLAIAAVVACSAAILPQGIDAAHAAPTATLARLPVASRFASALPDSAASLGHLDSQKFIRVTHTTYGVNHDGVVDAPDAVAFTADSIDGIQIVVSGAAVHDSWIWHEVAPGGVSFAQCTSEIEAAGDPGNTSGVIALVDNCSPFGTEIAVTFPDGCPCGFAFGVGLDIDDPRIHDYTGSWQEEVDYTDHDGSSVAPLVVTPFQLQTTPLVAVLHGWENHCTDVDALVNNVRRVMAVPDLYVQCHGYSSRDGVKSDACGRGPDNLGSFLQKMRESDPDHPNTVHLVGHSMGGLVARYYTELCHGADDPEVATVAMLGAPNEGVWIAGVLDDLCGWTALFNPHQLEACVAVNVAGRFAHVDLHSDAIRDLKPDSGVIKALDRNPLPDTTFYRAYIGIRNTPQGFLTALSLFNDCFIARRSVEGSNGQFKGSVLGSVGPELTYAGVSHTLFDSPLIETGCAEPILTDDDALAADITSDVKSYPLGPNRAAESLSRRVVSSASTDSASTGMPLLAAQFGVVAPGQNNESTIAIPSGTGEVAIAVIWPDADTPPALGFALGRPDGTPVRPDDPGVSADLALPAGSRTWCSPFR